MKPYANRKNKIFYLKQRSTKKGNVQYFFSQSQDGQVLHNIPEGYEIYENPRAQVFLVKSDSIKITQLETALLRKSVHQLSGIKNFKIDTKKNMLSVYITDQNTDALENIFKSGEICDGLDKDSFFNDACSYSAIIRFILTNEERRIFQAQCFFFAIDEWTDIGAPNNLKSLIDRYVPSLGQESISIHERRLNETLHGNPFLQRS